MNRSIKVGLAALAVLAIGMTTYALRRQRFEGSVERLAYGQHESLAKIFPAPAFAFPDQHGREVSRASLLGKTWIADFIFTQCTTACPMMTSRMVLLQRALADVDVAFVSFSVDPAHDSPPALAAYARTWNTTETRWELLATDKERLPRTLEGFHVTAKPTGDVENPIMHSSVFLLVDSEGWIRGAYDSNDGSARTQLAADVRALKPLAIAPSEQAQLYGALGCAGCHENPRVAPPLTNLLGGERMLADGRRVTIDEGYLRRSIVEPGAELVMGYSPLMPSYASLTSAQVDRLVHEIEERHSDAKPAPDATLVVDPICHMTVRTDPSAIHAGDHYFCSESCRDAFLANPEKYK